MLNKLALNGIKNRLRDYVVLFSGLIIGSAIFYMFMALATNRDFQKANASQVNATPLIFGLGAVLLIIITFVYIVYANTFLLSMRKRDYATFMMLGAKSSRISRLIFSETMMLGTAAAVVGVILGSGLTAVVGGFLMQTLDAPATHFVAVYPPAILATLVFFIVLFFLAALVNAGKMRRTPVLDLLRGDKTPARNKQKPAWQAVEAVLGVLLLAVGYFVMGQLKMFGILVFVIALVTIVLGSYLLFNAVIVSVIEMLRKNAAFSGKGLRKFTLAQIGFRTRSYTTILAAVSILFALALGAVTVGLGFYNEVPELTTSMSAYSLVQTNPTAADKTAASKLTGVTLTAQYSYKQDAKNVYLLQNELSAQPLRAMKYGEMHNTTVKLSAAQVAKTAAGTIDGLNMLLVKNVVGASVVHVVSTSEFAKVGLPAQHVTAYHVRDLRANIDQLRTLQQHQNKRYPELTTDAFGSTYSTYQMYNAFMSGFAFMGFFLGLAFLAMLASTLMFKILSGANDDQARYAMLRRIGVREVKLRRSVRTELATLFAAPAILGIVHVLFGLQLFKPLLLNAYANLTFPFGIFVLLYLVYFIITVWLYEGIVLKKKTV